MKGKVLISFIVLCAFLVSCSPSGGSFMNSPSTTTREKIPLYPNAKRVSLNDEEKRLLIEDWLGYMLGYDQILFASETSVTWTEDLGEEVKNQLEENLVTEKWRRELDWQQSWLETVQFLASKWVKGDVELWIFIFDNLTSFFLEWLQSYGISDVPPGSTLIMAHAMDTRQPLPNLTSTAEVESWQATATDQARSDAATATAAYRAWQASATADARIAIERATQEAKATARALSVLQQQLQSITDEFSGPKLSEQWTVYRSDETRWDLTSRPGFLHIVGDPVRETGPINIFGVDVPYTDIEVVTRIETTSLSEGSNVWIAFTPDDYSHTPNKISQLFTQYFDPRQTFELGIYLDQNLGPAVFMWFCPLEDECKNSSLGIETHHITPMSFNFEGTVYLKLVREGNTYTGYYSTDGELWSYVGQAKDFPMVGQVTLGACGEGDFHVYIDYIRFSLPTGK